MADIIAKIMTEIESDPMINAKEICLDMISTGFLKRRKALNVHGSVKSAADKERMMKIVQREVGDNYYIGDKLAVK